MCGMLTVPVILMLSSCLLVADRQQPRSGFKHCQPSLLTRSIPGLQSRLVRYQRRSVEVLDPFCSQLHPLIT